MTDDVLPDCRASEVRGRVTVRGVSFVPVFCANCGADQGLVSENHTTFAFMLCPKCEEKHGVPANFMRVPDEVFWQRVDDAQREEYGRVLSHDELVRALDDPSSPVAMLAREAPRGGR